MVFILHRYIFKELLKVFLLSAVALGVILNLGSLLRSIQEYGVGPEQILDIIGYFLPVTLTFVLPVAALFATSLVYGRFAADNEFTACKASGISPSMLIYPGLILAFIVAITNLMLSFHIVPAYAHRAENAVKADAKQILFRNIHRQGYYNMPGGEFRIYADAADSANSSLLGVVVIEVGKNKKLTTAESATINFVEGQKSEVRVLAQNAFQFDESGRGAYFKTIVVSAPFESLSTDNIKFQKIEQMNAIKASPINYYPVAAIAWEAYERLTIDMLAEDVNKSISSEKDSFYQFYSHDKLYRISADSSQILDGTNAIEMSGNVVLFEYDKGNGDLLKSYRGDKLTIQLSKEGDKRPSSSLIIIFPNAVWLDRGVEYIKPRYAAQDIALPTPVAAKLGEDIIDTVKQHRYVSQPSEALQSLIKEVDRKIMKTLFDIKAEIHSRLVFGIGCITLILIGIGLGIQFRGGHLLTAFGVSSIPAVILLVFIMAGKNIVKNKCTEIGADIGVGLMWAGLLILSLFAFMLYRKLLRN